MRLRCVRKTIDQTALIENYRQLKNICAPSRILAVVKCNGYGHGMIRVSQILAQLDDLDGFAVASVTEAVALREAGIEHKILAMQGAHHVSEFKLLARNAISSVIHSNEQLDWLEQNPNSDRFDVWIKIDTGMGRLGFRMDTARQAIQRVLRLKNLTDEPVLMSHFARADEADLAYTQQQIESLQEILKDYPLAGSIANSAACLRVPQSRLQWTRAGIALYGSVPKFVAEECRLLFKPVMTLATDLIAIRRFKQGESIGYGSSYVCPQEMTVGIAAIGYGDGYPYQTQEHVPVWINGTHQQLLGRVSMDMIAISLHDVDAAVGDEVELWGHHVLLQEVAKQSNTLDYELLTSASNIVEV